MDIILVTSTTDEFVHGTDNEKKTGCGINLQKGENVTRFRRSGVMSDLKEITCKKCKDVIAKKLIKADKKEMARLLKEERQREKLGIVDEGIIPLGNTTAKITSAQPVYTPQPEPPAPALPPKPEVPAKTVAGTGIAIDNDLAQFAIKVPAKEEEPEPVQQTPPPSPASNVQDDFLAQFAIEKPQEEKPAPANNLQDDFLAQFAVQKPDDDDEDITASVPDQNGQVYGDATGMSNYNYENYQSVSSVPEDEEETSAKPGGQALINAGMADEDEIMKMFSFGFGMPLSQNQPSQNAQQTAPVSEPVQPDISDDVFDSVPEAEPVAVQENSYGDYGTSEPVLSNEYESAKKLEESDEWDSLNKLFGIDGQQVQETSGAMEELGQPTAESIAPVQPAPQPILEDIQPYQPEPVQQTAPVTPPVLDDIAIEDIVVPQINPVRPVQQSSPVVTPVLDDLGDMNISVPKANPVQQTAPVTPPVLDDIAIEDIVVPQINPVRPVQQSAPVYEEPVYEEPVYEEPVYEEENANEGIAESVLTDNIEDIVVPEIKPVSIRKEEYQETVVQPVQEAVPQPVAQPVQTAVPQPVAQPVQTAVPQPVAQPVQTVAPQPVVQPVQTVAPQPVVQPVQAVVPPVVPQPMVQPVQNVAPQAAQTIGQIVNIPQFAGYDANNQPVYTYIQMQMSGYDANGQPVYMPLQNMPYQQPVVPPAPVVQPVIQPAPVHSIPKPETNQPLTIGQKIMAAEAARKAAGIADNSANISKIAVHEHSRSTSQAFINAIAESKEYANQSLTETEGLMARGPVLNSIEDILSSMGDDSLKRAKQQKAMTQQQVPVYQEYRASSPQTASRRPSPASQEVSRPLSPAELKEKKKQDKINAKFKKKNGLL